MPSITSYATTTKMLALSMQSSSSRRSTIYEKDIQDELYYHGFMSRLEAEACLKLQGHFLVRRIQEEDEQMYVVSVQWDEQKLHYRIQQTDHKNFFYLNQHCKRNIPALIRFHRFEQVPISAKTNARIILPSERTHYTIYREQIKLGEKLGEGEFGAVYKGVLRSGLFERVDVAVKTMKFVGPAISMDERIKFLREANVMMKLKHPNVIRLFGVCVYEDPIWIVLEEAKCGSLLGRLTNTQNVPKPMEKERFSNELCLGMCYLEEYSVIHRDLAARNCLLDGRDTLKIADFGLSIKGSKSVVIKHGRVPIRWMAPETLKEGVFSSKSDVWSYGVVLYEIWENGKQPYYEISTVKAVYKGVIDGTLKLNTPAEITPKYRAIMDSCFTYEHEKRPSFKNLAAQITRK